MQTTTHFYDLNIIYVSVQECITLVFVINKIKGIQQKESFTTYGLHSMNYKMREINSVSPRNAQISSEWPSTHIQDADPILIWCWASVVEGGPTSNQYWANVLYFLVFNQTETLKQPCEMDFYLSTYLSETRMRLSRSLSDMFSLRFCSRANYTLNNIR